jgi:hypothetical protein
MFVLLHFCQQSRDPGASFKAFFFFSSLSSVETHALVAIEDF